MITCWTRSRELATLQIVLFACWVLAWTACRTFLKRLLVHFLYLCVDCFSPEANDLALGRQQAHFLPHCPLWVAIPSNPSSVSQLYHSATGFNRPMAISGRVVHGQLWIDSRLCMCYFIVRSCPSLWNRSDHSVFCRLVTMDLSVCLTVSVRWSRWKSWLSTAIFSPKSRTPLPFYQSFRSSKQTQIALPM